MIKTLDQEARAGFPRMRGGKLHAVVPISQELLDELLSKLSMHVEVLERNRIEFFWRMFRAAAEIVEVTPDLTVVLSTSWLSRTALRGVLAWKPDIRQYLGQQDRFVYILCGRIPAVARYRYCWRHVSNVEVRTTAGRLLLDVDAQIR